MTAAALREAAKPHRPPRPLLVELASAFLIVSGVLSAVGTINIAWGLGQTIDGVGPLVLFILAISVATPVLGVLIRYARAWIVTLNVAAVAGFLELTSGSQAGMIVGLLDVFVVLALLTTRPWFAWSPQGAAGHGEDEQD